MRLKIRPVTSIQPSFLYVEDHPASQKVMQMMLVDMLGYTDLTILDDGRELAQRLLAAGKTYDVIFLDINLRGIYGYTICEALRQHPEFADTKIIAITAALESSNIYQLQQAGFSGAISKPLALDTFPKLVDAILASEAVWDD